MIVILDAWVVAECLLDVVDEDSGRLVRPSVLPTPTPDEPPALSTFCLLPVFTPYLSQCCNLHTQHILPLTTLSLCPTLYTREGLITPRM